MIHNLDLKRKKSVFLFGKLNVIKLKERKEKRDKHSQEVVPFQIFVPNRLLVLMSSLDLRHVYLSCDRFLLDCRLGDYFITITCAINLTVT